MGRVSSQQVTYATCACTIEYGLYRTGSDYDGASATPETIITTCDVHEAITDPQTLHDTVLAEVQPLGRAFGLIYGTHNSPYYVISWTINDQRTIDLVMQDVAGVGATIRSRLAAIPNLSVTYE